MNIECAKAQMYERMAAHAEKFAALGFRASVRVYYTDKSLSEYDEYKKGCDTLWCDLQISTPEMEEDDGLIYGLFAEIDKNGTEIKDAAPKNESQIENTLNELYAEASESDDPKASFSKEYERITQEFNEKMNEFESKMKRLKYLSYAAIGVILISIAAVFIASLL